MELLEVANLTLYHRREEGGRLRRGRGGEPLIEDLSFVLPRGQSLALVSESCEAMTELALALLKMRPVEGGRIRFRDLEIGALREERFRPMRRHLQAVFPEAMGQLSPGRTVRECFREVLSIWMRHDSREERARRVEAVMIACGLPEAVQDLYPVELDAAERQLVALARALLPGPDLLICRGWVEGLDVVQQAELLCRLRQVREAFGLSLLLLGDDLAPVSGLVDAIGILHQGRLLEYGSYERVTSQPAHERTRRLLAAAAARTEAFPP